MEILIHRSSTMATMVKPKERQFQVVPVPAIFTRGRWECRDFKESSNFAVLSNAGGNGNTENIQIFEFQSQSHHMHSDVPSTIPLMRHDVKNMVATSIVLPEILPGVDTSMISNVGSIVGTGFVSQVTIMESDANRDGSASSGAVTTTNQNSVAIDNKIEQAMDLVKTHLTFAVREEVEQLRTQISDLESKVNNLESENQILRQFTPAEVVANLPLLLQQHKAQSSTASSNVDALGTLHISQSQSVQVLQHPTPPQYSSATIPSVSSAPILGNVVSQPSSAQVNVGQPQMQQQTITQKQSILPKTRSPTPTTSIGKVSAQTDGNATQHQ